MATRVRENRHAGRRQRQRSHTGRTRRPNLKKFYGRRLTDITPGEFEFELHLLRGGGKRPLPLDTVTESFDWADEEAVMTGSLALRRPDPEKASSLPVARGYRVRCRVRWGNRRGWYELWTMRCKAPAASLPGGTVAVELEDDLVLLDRNKREWHFRKTKRRKVGYFAHEIARAVAKREGVRLGKIAKGTKRINKLEGEMSGLDVLRKAYQHERDKTGRRFVIRMRRGLLEIVPYHRNRLLYTFGPFLTSADSTEDTGDEEKATVTVLEGVGHIGKGQHAKKVRHTEMNRTLVGRLGYLHKKKNYGKVDGAADLRGRVKRDYAKGVRVKRVATLETPGVPFIRRGDGIRWITREPGWHGRSESSLDRSYVFTTAVRHRVEATSYRTEFDIGQVDPFVKDQERLAKDARERRRKERRRRRRENS